MSSAARRSLVAVALGVVALAAASHAWMAPTTAQLFQQVWIEVRKSQHFQELHSGMFAFTIIPSLPSSELRNRSP
jgi:hypothetical protein